MCFSYSFDLSSHTNDNRSRLAELLSAFDSLRVLFVDASDAAAKGPRAGVDDREHIATVLRPRTVKENVDMELVRSFPSVFLVMEDLPGLRSVNGVASPFQLHSQKQWGAAKTLFRCVGIGPNSLCEVDVSGSSAEMRRRTMEDDALSFRDLRACLSQLPVRSLFLRDSPLLQRAAASLKGNTQTSHPKEGKKAAAAVEEAEEVLHYRFLCISEIASLDFIDGDFITADERANADQVLAKLLARSYTPPQLPSKATAVIKVRKL